MLMDELSLGPRIKRVFIAFLVSNFVSYVQVWLGLEYKNLAKDLGAFKAQDIMHESNLSRASILFKKASTLTLISFGLGIAMTIIFYSVYSKLLISMTVLMNATSSSFSSLFSTLLMPLIVVIILMLVVISIVNLITNNTLISAWNLVLSHFTANCAGMSWMPEASRQVERIIRGTKKSKIASELTIITGVILAGFFVLLFEFLISTSMSRVFIYAMYAFGIALSIFLLLIAIFNLQGTINQAIGLFDLSKVLQGNYAQVGTKPAFGGYQINQQPSSHSMNPQAREIPMRVIENRFCPDCGFKLEPEWKAQFCPKCGGKLT